METEKVKQDKTLYFIAKYDSYGQRSGTYERIYLSEDEIEFNHMGWKFYKGQFLYESEIEIIYACLD